MILTGQKSLIKYKGLTLIEVLMSILLFGSGIVVILSIIIQNISLAQRIQDKTISTMLAKEAIEMFYSYKDTNIDKGEYWDAFDGGYFETSMDYCIRRNLEGKITIEKSCTGPSQQLIEYINTGSINTEGSMFRHGNIPNPADWKLSKFKRYCRFTEIEGITTPNKLKREGGDGHLALIISCTVDPKSVGSVSANRSVTLSSMIGQNRE